MSKYTLSEAHQELMRLQRDNIIPQYSSMALSNKPLVQHFQLLIDGRWINKLYWQSFITLRFR